MKTPLQFMPGDLVRVIQTSDVDPIWMPSGSIGLCGIILRKMTGDEDGIWSSKNMYKVIIFDRNNQEKLVSLHSLDMERLNDEQ